jgi:hypothetical protein
MLTPRSDEMDGSLATVNGPPLGTNDRPDRWDRTADVHPQKGSAVAYIERGQALYTQLATPYASRSSAAHCPRAAPCPTKPT